MAFTNAKQSNNAQGQLQAGISASATSIILQSGQGWLFPSTFPFWVKIEQYDTAINNYRVLKRELVLVTNRSADTLTVTRSAGNCPASYNATTQTNTAFSFNTGDTITQTLTAEDIKDMKDTIATALQTDAYQNRTPTYIASTGSTNAYAITLVPAPTAYVAGQAFAFKANASNTGATTLNVNGLGTKNIYRNGNTTPFTGGEIVSGMIVEVTYDGTNFQMQTPSAQSVITSIVGEVRLWTTATSPSGWLSCDGSAVSRTSYATLFGVLGTTYGVGDGSTTFNLPNMKGAVAVGYDASQSEFNAMGKTGGAKTHVLTVNEMPAHTHNYNNFAGWNTTYSSPSGINSTSTSSATSSTGSGAAHNNLQPYVTLNYIIKT